MNQTKFIKPENITLPKLTANVYLNGIICMYGERMGGQNHYLEYHKMMDGKMSAGKPLEKETMRKIYSFTEKHQKHIPRCAGPIPQNILLFNYSEQKELLAWWTPEQRKKIVFTKKLVKKYRLAKNTLVWYPSMLWIASGEKLDVFILPSTKKISNSTMAYKPFFPNVNDRGDVCIGNVNVDNLARMETIQDIMAWWENFFLNSQFSHDGDAMKFWVQQIKSRAKYPKEKMNKTNKIETIENLLEEL